MLLGLFSKVLEVTTGKNHPIYTLKGKKIRKYLKILSLGKLGMLTSNI
jgi:hypothetical protein